MNNASALKFKLEIIWWIITFVIVAAVLFPLRAYFDGFPFLKANIISIVAFLTFSRYIFLLKHTFLAELQKVKFVLIILCLPLFFYFMNEINAFQTLLDERGLAAILGESKKTDFYSLGKYLRTEFLLFSVGALIATVALFFRMIISIWRFRNKGTV